MISRVEGGTITALPLPGLPAAPREGPGDGIVPSDDDWRIDVLATFGSAGARGGSGASGTFDVNLNGVIDGDDPSTPLVDESEKNNIRTVQQRKRFDPPPCDWINDTVTLEDLGAYAEDPDCVDVTTSCLYEVIAATGIPGTTYTFYVEGTVTCLGQTFQDILDETKGDDGVVQLKVQYPYAGGPAYFPTSTLSGAGKPGGPGRTQVRLVCFPLRAPYGSRRPYDLPLTAGIKSRRPFDGVHHGSSRSIGNAHTIGLGQTRQSGSSPRR